MINNTLPFLDMKHYKVTIFALLLLVLSCETDHIEKEPQKNTTTKVSLNKNFRPRGGKSARIKEKRLYRGKYKSTIKLIDDTTGGMTQSIKVDLHPSENGTMPVPSSFLASRGNTNNNGITKFNFNALEFEGAPPNGQVFKAILTPLDLDSQPTEASEDIWITVQDNDGVNVILTSLQKAKDDNITIYDGTLNSTTEHEIIEGKLKIIDLSSNTALVEQVLFITATDQNGVVKTKLNGTIDATENDELYEIMQANNEIKTILTTINAIGEIQDEDIFMETITPYVPKIQVKYPSIKLKNNGETFKFRTTIKGNDRSDVASIDVIFSDYSGPEPIPTEFNTLVKHQNTNADVYTFEELTFDNSATAVGDVYTIILVLRDEQGMIISSEEFNVSIEE